MQDTKSEEQLHLLQQEMALAGEAIETLRRDQRAENDALRLEIAVLQRCLLQLHPEFVAQFETIRATIRRELDPETS